MFTKKIQEAINKGKAAHQENLLNTCTDITNKLAQDVESHAARGCNVTAFNIYKTNGIDADVIAKFIIEQTKDVKIRIHTADNEFASIIVEW